jgi:hypothetical protein
MRKYLKTGVEIADVGLVIRGCKKPPEGKVRYFFHVLADVQRIDVSTPCVLLRCRVRRDYFSTNGIKTEIAIVAKMTASGVKNPSSHPMTACFLDWCFGAFVARRKVKRHAGAEMRNTTIPGTSSVLKTVFRAPTIVAAPKKEDKPYK